MKRLKKRKLRYQGGGVQMSPALKKTIQEFDFESTKVTPENQRRRRLTPAQGTADYFPLETFALPGTPVIKGIGKLANMAIDAANPLSGMGKVPKRLEGKAAVDYLKKQNPVPKKRNIWQSKMALDAMDNSKAMENPASWHNIYDKGRTLTELVQRRDAKGYLLDIPPFNDNIYGLSKSSGYTPIPRLNQEVNEMMTSAIYGKKKLLTKENFRSPGSDLERRSISHQRYDPERWSEVNEELHRGMYPDRYSPVERGQTINNNPFTTYEGKGNIKVNTDHTPLWEQGLRQKHNTYKEFMKDMDVTDLNYKKITSLGPRMQKIATDKFKEEYKVPYTGTHAYQDISPYQSGGPIVDPMGQYNHPGEVTRIPSNSITMRNINYPVKAVPNKGKPKIMQPGAQYYFPGASYVDEYPMAQKVIYSKGQARMGGPSPSKAREMLKDGTAHGKKLTAKQKRYFGMIYGNSKRQMGGGMGDHLSVYPMMMQAGGVSRDNTNVTRYIPKPSQGQLLLNPVYDYANQVYGAFADFGDNREQWMDYVIKHKDDSDLQRKNPFDWGVRMLDYRKERKEQKRHGGEPCYECGGDMKDGGSSQYQFPDEMTFPEKRKNEFLQWLRNTSFDVIQDEFNNEGFHTMPDGSVMSDTEMKKGGHWIQKAVNPKHKGYCTPMTKSTCTPRRKALARTFKKHHGFRQYGGEPVVNQYSGPYQPWWDYFPNVAQKSYKQYSLNPMNVTMTDPNNIGTPDFPGVQPTGPRATQDVYNPMWTNEDLETRNKALDIASGNLPLIQDDQQALGNRNQLMKNITSVPPEQYRTVNKKTVRPNWKDRWWANPDTINMGMEAATNIINNLPGGANQRHKKWLKKTTAADWWNTASRGNRGDYTQNYGYFKPDQTTPIQYPGSAGMYQYKSGGTYYITPEDEKRILAMGGQVEYID